MPETFATGFAVNLDCGEAENGSVLSWLKTQAKQHNAVIAGSVLVTQGDKKANRFYWVQPNGEMSYYDKRHLFCLGNEGEFVVPGQIRKVFELNGFKILPQVCYDLRFPVFQRNNNDYDVMINIANWPAARRNVWDTLLMARAMLGIEPGSIRRRQIIGNENDGAGFGHAIADGREFSSKLIERRFI